MPAPWLWFVVAVVLLIGELLTGGIVAVFVAAGALAGAVVAALGAELSVQIVVASVVAFAGVAIARRPIIRLMKKGAPVITVPGVQNLIGQRALTIDEVGDEHHPGHALLAGEHWLAITDARAPLAPDVAVEIAEIRGTTLLVRPVTESVSS